ncbi:hypothetical protein [Glycomyces xiaoerkulensis]|uniref:hypothetical protein n=1 Tax=Glycomyces xiaoerkulensis TaxID=2038139 RepID=UPI0012FFDDD9|nr:hypothetical protein [Glycomyces xiaoerkulensis]
MLLVISLPLRPLDHFMPSELTQDQLDKLIALMSFGGSASNNELRQRYRFALTGVKRTSLVNAGLISSDRASSRDPFQHELTDEGRELCREALEAGPAAGAGLGHRIHQGMLERLVQLLEAHGIDVFDSVAAEPEVATRESLSAAYFELTPSAGEWVSLTELRSKLQDVERASLDRLIHDLHVGGDVALIPEENRRSITPDDRAAAIRIGDEDRHLISIGRPL